MQKKTLSFIFIACSAVSMTAIADAVQTGTLYTISEPSPCGLDLTSGAYSAANYGGGGQAVAANTGANFANNPVGSQTCYYQFTALNPTPSIFSNLLAGVSGTDAVNVDQLNTGLTNANNYTNAVWTAANNYTTAVGSSVLGQANGYTDSQVAGLGTKTNGSLSSVAASFGGAASYNPVTGAFTQPTYTVSGTNYNNAGSALNAIQTSTANNQAALGNSTAAGLGGGSTYNPATGAISNPTIGVAGTNYSNTTGAIQALDSKAIKYDNNANGTPNYSSATLGNGTGTTTLHNVTTGVAGTDAVNVSQLNTGLSNTLTTANTYTNNQVSGLSTKTNSSLASVASTLGGGATYNTVTGAITPSTYTVGGTNYSNVGSALNATGAMTNGLGTSTAAALGGGSSYNPTTGTVSAPTITATGGTYNDTTSAIQALDANAIKYDQNVNGTPNYSSATLGNGTGTTALHNVTAGVAGTDAANVSQLNAGLSNTLTSANTYTNSQVSALGATTANNQAALGNSTASTLGGGATYNPATGAITQSTYTVGGTNYSDVGSALNATGAMTNGLGTSTAAALGGNSTYNSATGEISNPTITAAGGTYSDTTSAIQALDKSAIQYDKTTGGAVDTTNVTLQGVGGTTLHKVKDGVVLTDAANVGQVQTAQTNAVSAANTYTDNTAATTLTSANTYTNSKITTVTATTDTLGTTTAAGLGGGSTYNSATGAISNPTITAAGGTYNDTTSAIQALDKSAIQYDKTAGGAVDTTNVTLQGVGGTTLHKVKDGVVLTDAANVGQVQTAQTNAVSAANTYTDNTAANTLTSANTYTDTKITGVTATTDALGTTTAAGLGGGSTYNPATGAISNPTITAAGGTYSDTTSAIQALDKSAIQYDKTAGGAVDTTNVTLQGVGGTTLHNVAAGTLPTDAANTQQVIDSQNNAITTANGYTNAQIASLGNQTQSQVKTLSAQIKSTGSIAAAMSGLVPNYHSASNLQVQAAVGYGSGAAAIGTGATYQISNDVLLVGKIGVSTTSSVGIANRIGGAVGVSLGL